MKKMLEVWVWVWLCILALLLISAEVKAEWYDESALERALYSRMVMWKTPKGKLVTIRHCGDGKSCQERIKLFSGWIQKASLEHGLDQWVLGAIAFHESGLNPMATGAAGERGIFQLHPKGAGRDLDFVKREDFRKLCSSSPGACQEDVIMSAAKLLRKGIDVCKSLPKALGYYNGGRCEETDYSKRILWQKSKLISSGSSYAKGAPGLCQYCPSEGEKSFSQSTPLHCAELL